MSGFLYYLPGGTLADAARERLIELGLGHAFDGGCTAAPVMRGPGDDDQDGPAGVVLADPQRVGKIGFYPKEQTWRRGAAAARAVESREEKVELPDGQPREVWVGFFANDRPTPAVLVRRQMLDGHPVRLGDGNDWVVPIVRGFGESFAERFITLPRAVELDADGKVTAGAVLPEYRHVLEGVAAYNDACVAAVVEAEGTEAARVRFEHTPDVAFELLGLNYAIGPAEIVALELFVWQRSHFGDVMDAALDMPGLVAIQKKKGAGG